MQMTATLRKAFSRASDLPAQTQEVLAEQLLEDIDGELKWDATLANSQSLLEKMAKKAAEAKKRGRPHSKK
jgi:hypothetical protein